MTGSKVIKVREVARAGLTSGFIAMDEARISKLTDSLTEFSHEGLDRFESIATQDCLLIIKIFEEATRYHCGPDKSSVASLAEAMHILGSERFQRLIRRVTKRSASLPAMDKSILKESVNEAYVAGLMAESLATEIGISNPSRYLVSAQLHQLGRVLISRALPLEFERRSLLVPTLGRVDAEKQIFGSSLTELTQELIEELPVPPDVKTSLRHSCYMERHGDSFPNSGGGQAIYSMARESLELISRTNLDWEGLERGVDELVPLMSKEVPFTREDFFRMVQSTNEKLQEFRKRRIYEPGEDESSFLSRIDIISERKPTVFPPLQRSQILPLFKMNDGSWAAIDEKTASHLEATSTNSGPSGLSIATTILGAFEDIASMDMQTMAEFLAWAHHKSFQLHNCLLFMPTHQADELTLVHAEGTWFVESMANVVVPVDQKTIFSPVLRTGRDMIMSPAVTRRFSNHIPLWLRDKAREYPLAVLPVTGRRGVLALLIGLGDRLESASQNPEVLAESWAVRSIASHAWDQLNLPSIIADSEPSVSL